MKSIEEKRAEFRKLHQSGCFAIPNPWDIGSAKYLQHLGFKAIATTSAGFAFSRGLSDGSVTPTIQTGARKTRTSALTLESLVSRSKMQPIERKVRSTMSILQWRESTL